MNRMTGLFLAALATAALFCSSFSVAQPRYSAVGDFYAETCSSCHGDVLQGTSLGSPLVGVELKNGSSVEEVKRSISQGDLEKGMPVWSSVLKDEQLQSLAIYVVEQRSGFSYDDYRVRFKLDIPKEVQQTELHEFVLDTFIDDIDPLPFSIAPLSDGRVLLTEKKLGLSIISADGIQSGRISGTPRVFADSTMNADGRALDRGMGWMQDIAIHPDYESNGWIYIYYGDRCDSCNAISRAENQSVSMAKLVRGRIRDNEWVDEETIWSTGFENYTAITDLLLGGRIAFDDKGFIYFSVGAKDGFYDAGIQDLGKPWGKIHRVFDDGRIPVDNPFVDVAGAVQSIWTFGHRVPQGLEYDAKTGILWSTEHGARGGDEVNLIAPGRNYGWPLTSRGVDYDGSSIEGKLDIKFNMEDIEQPVVDLTPSPAISSFVVYQGDQFPRWKGNLIVGSLKANTLFRFSIEDNVLIEKEVLVEGIGRIRDIEVGSEGHILLLIENAGGGKVLRMRPAD